MARKTQISKEVILEAALKMLIRDGYSAINIKTLSKAIGCSTQPLVWHFDNMEGLRKALADHALKDADRAANLSDMGVRWLDEPCAQDRNQERQRQDAEQENGQTVETARERREVGKEVVPVKDQRPHPAKLTRHILHGERDELLQTERGKVIDGNGHLFVGEEVDEIVAERERKVISLRFGLEDGHPRTLEEVGREFGVTRERIRQIESKTLAKLRHPSRSSKLKDYLED